MDDSAPKAPDAPDELSHFDPFVRAVIEKWTSEGVVELDPEQMEDFVLELKHRAAEAESPYRMLKALAKQVEVSDCVEEYYASREELIDLIRDLADD